MSARAIGVPPDTERADGLLSSLVSGVVLAFAGSRANIARTILSCAGIVVGVGALILVVAASDFGQRYAVAFSESNIGRPATMSVFVYEEEITDLAAFENDLRRAGGLEVSIVHRPAAEPRVRSGDEVFNDVDVRGVDVELGEIRRMNMVSGRWFTEADQQSLAPALVINEGLATALGYSDDIEIGTREWLSGRVVGVIEDSALDWGQYSVYVLRGPASEELLFGGASGEAASVEYNVRIDENDPAAEPFSDLYQQRLASVAAQWGVEDPANNLGAYRMDYGDEIEEVITYLAWGLMGIAAITLSTGLLGVLNVGLVTVRERRKELATYRALGANRLTLFVAVVAEAVVVALVAGLIALAGCYVVVAVSAGVLGALVSLPQGVSLYVPWNGVLVGLGSAAFVGLLAGIIPAWRALKVSVVAGLRE